MAGPTSELYAPLIERDLDLIPQAVATFLEKQSVEDLWVAITRFAVLAYAPSQHSKRAVVACRSALVVRDELKERWVAALTECARYASASRQPWSEPPILEPPPVEEGAPSDLDELESAIAAGDRLRAERWLSARLQDCEDDLRRIARGDAALILDTALFLAPHLGEKGRFALLRMPLQELGGEVDDVQDPLDTLVRRAIDAKGSVDAVSAVFIAANSLPVIAAPTSIPLEPYHLARDFAQTLISHDVARRLPNHREEFLAAVHHNLEHGESFESWSFA